MGDDLDKKDQELLDELLNSTDNKPVQPASQIVFLAPSKPPVAVGGLALSQRARVIPQQRQGLRSAHEEALYQEALDEERRQFIADDPVVQAAAGRDSLAVLGAIKMQAAQEAASLAFAKSLLERQGKDATQTAVKHLDALKKIADIELEMRKIGVDQLDITGEKFQRVLKYFLGVVKTAAQQTMNSEQADLFFVKLTTEMEGWVDKVAEIIK